MAETPSRQWVEQHRVSYEMAPLMEGVKGHGVQRTGYEINLYALLDPGNPNDEDPGREPQAEAVYDGLRRLMQHAIATGPVSPSHLEILPFDHSARLRPESKYQAEVQLTIQVTPKDSKQKLTDADAAASIARAEARLAELGLRRKSWDSGGAS
jgi:hypothetical protein